MSPGVFISYSNDSDDHVRNVHELALKLKSDGLSVVIDRDMLPGGPDKGWSTWSLSQVESAQRVLVACTPTYRRRYDLEEDSGKGLGATCEAAAIRRLLVESAGHNQKFRVVLFAANDLGTIPVQLRDHQHFLLYERDGYLSLVDWLRGAASSASTNHHRQGVHWPAALADYECPLAGRSGELAAFARIASGKSSKRILIVKAASNGGKTALVNEYFGYARRVGLAASRIDLKGCPSLDDVLEAVRTDLRDVLPPPSSGSTSSRSYQVLSDLQRASAPVLIAFDTYEHASRDVSRWLEGVVLPRLESSPALVIVIGGQQVPEHEKHCWRTLTAFCDLLPVRDVQSWRDYARRTWKAVDIDENQIRTLILATNGNPGLLSLLLSNYVSNTSENSEWHRA
jgi:hypothetical protein